MGTPPALGGSYLLDTVIGEDATGRVWRGADRDGNPRAVKVLRSDLASDPGVGHRFLQARGLLASIRHPHVVGVHDLLVEEDTLAVVTDYVEGCDLRAVIREFGSIPPGRVARWGQHLALALAALHARGVVHRDVKPENVLLESSTGRARLTDVGIVDLVDGAQRALQGLDSAPYQAPELADGADPSPAADLYSLGVVLYEVSCGVPPFAGRAAATARPHGSPGRPAGVPDPLWDLVCWLLETDPGRRPPSAGVVADLLGSLRVALDGAPPAPRLAHPPPAGRAPCGASGVLVGTVSVLAVLAVCLGVLAVMSRGSAPVSDARAVARASAATRTGSTGGAPQTGALAAASAPVTPAGAASPAPGGAPAPTQREADAVVSTYQSLRQTGSLGPGQMAALFTPTVQWYGATLTRAQLSEQLFPVRPAPHRRVDDGPVYRGFHGGVHDGGASSSRIDYDVGYQEPAASGTVIVHYTVVKDTDGATRIAAVCETAV